MADIVQMNGYLLSKMADLRTFFNSLLPFCGLYQNDLTPTPEDVLGDYVPCDYDGASLLPVLWGSDPFIETSGTATMYGATLIFQPTGTAMPNPVYGYYVINSITAELLYAQRFSGAPLSIGGTLTALPVQPTWRDRSIA